MSSKAHILLVEDEQNFGAVLKNYLELSGYTVDLCPNGFVGSSQFRQKKYDLCILDVMMPEKDGFTLGKEIRELDPHIPMIFLTAKAMKEDQVRGFKIGADDYLIKPFDTELLLWKIKALIKRQGIRQEEAEEAEITFTIGEFRFNRKLRTLEFDGQEPERLSPKENALLGLLCEHHNDVLPRKKALLQIWKDDSYFATRSMDVYIAKLRKRLKKDPLLEIENIHGEGYRLLEK